MPQNPQEREQLFKLKDNVGTRTNGYKLAENKLVWKLNRGFEPSEREVSFCNILPREKKLNKY